MQDFTQHRLEYMYQDPSVISAVNPVMGVLSGGTLLTVAGSSCARGAGLVCKFGSTVPVAATWHSDEMLLCTSRPLVELGNMTLEVATNNQDFSSSGVY